MHWNLDLYKRTVLDNVLFFIISANESEEYMSWINSELLYENFEFVGTVDDIYPTYDSEEGQTICVYKNKNYIGDAWFVYEYTICDVDMPMEEKFSIINNPTFDVKNHVLIESDDNNALNLLKRISKQDENAGINIEKYTNNTIELSCHTSTEAILVMAESDANGWKAYVDGERTKILTADYGKRCILIGPGEHKVKFIYCPDSYVVGAAITGGTIIFITVLFAAFLRSFLRTKTQGTEIKKIE